MTIFRRGKLWIAAALGVGLIAVAPNAAHAAGGAYQVDTAEIAGPGNCKIESWASGSDHKDFFAAISPSCTMYFLRPIELGAQFSRQRLDGEWGTGVTPKVKINLIPGEIGKFGLAISAVATEDLLTLRASNFAINLPATMRVSENVRFNVNVGWAYDRLNERSYATYGLGIDARTSDNKWILTAELYGQANGADQTSAVDPRFQVGLRYRPIDRFSVDLIYGRNISGENRNWLTLATIYRFPADK